MNRAGTYFTATVPALVVLGFFVWFANWIPQTRWQPPEKLEISEDMDPLELAEAGKTIVRQTGCMACHTLEPGVGVHGQGRGPNFANIAARRAKGVADGPGTLVDYLAQALYEPGAYLVEDFGDIMPAATGPPAKLDYKEVVAVIAYLQSLGNTPSVRVGDVPRPPGGAGERAVAAEPVSAGAGPQALLDRFQCTGCHSLKPGETLVGPPLDRAALEQAAAERGMSAEAYVLESIVDPEAAAREGFPKGVMPGDYGEQLTAGQLAAMVRHLLGGEEGK